MKYIKNIRKFRSILRCIGITLIILMLSGAGYAYRDGRVRVADPFIEISYDLDSDPYRLWGEIQADYYIRYDISAGKGGLTRADISFSETVDSVLEEYGITWEIIDNDKYLNIIADQCSLRIGILEETDSTLYAGLIKLGNLEEVTGDLRLYNNDDIHIGLLYGNEAPEADMSVDYSPGSLDVGGKIGDNSFSLHGEEDMISVETEGILDSGLAYEKDRDQEKISGVIGDVQIDIGQYADGNGPSTYAELYHNKDKNLYIKDYGDEQHIYGTFNDATWELRHSLDYQENDIVSANLDLFDHDLYLDAGLAIYDNYEVALTRDFNARVGDNSLFISRDENNENTYYISMTGIVEADLRYDKYGDTEYISGPVEGIGVYLGKYKDEAFLGSLSYDWGYASILGWMNNGNLYSSGDIFGGMGEWGYYSTSFTQVDDFNFYGSFSNLGSRGILNTYIYDNDAYLYADLSGDNGDTLFVIADNDEQNITGDLGSIIWGLAHSVDNNNIHKSSGYLEIPDYDWKLNIDNIEIGTGKTDVSVELDDYHIDYEYLKDEDGYSVVFSDSDEDNIDLTLNNELNVDVHVNKNDLYLDTGLTINDNYEIRLTRDLKAGVGDSSFSITRDKDNENSYDIDMTGLVEADLRYDNYGDTEYIRGLIENQNVTLGKYKNEALLGMLNYDWGYAYLTGSLQDSLYLSGNIYENWNNRGYLYSTFTRLNDFNVYTSFANLGSEGVIEGRVKGNKVYAQIDITGDNGDIFFMEADNKAQSIKGNINDVEWGFEYTRDENKNKVVSANLDAFDHDLYVDTGLKIDDYEISIIGDLKAGIGGNSLSIVQDKDNENSFDIDMTGLVEADLRYEKFGDTEYLRGLIENQNVTLGKYKSEALLGMLNYDWGYAYLAGSLRDSLGLYGRIYENVNEYGYLDSTFTSLNDFNVYTSFANLGSEGVLEGRIKGDKVYAEVDFTGDNGDTDIGFILDDNYEIRLTRDLKAGIGGSSLSIVRDKDDENSFDIDMTGLVEADLRYEKFGDVEYISGLVENQNIRLGKYKSEALLGMLNYDWGYAYLTGWLRDSLDLSGSIYENMNERGNLYSTFTSINDFSVNASFANLGSEGVLEGSVKNNDVYAYADLTGDNGDTFFMEADNKAQSIKGNINDLKWGLEYTRDGNKNKVISANVDAFDHDLYVDTGLTIDDYEIRLTRDLKAGIGDSSLSITQDKDNENSYDIDMTGLVEADLKYDKDKETTDISGLVENTEVVLFFEADNDEQSTSGNIGGSTWDLNHSVDDNDVHKLSGHLEVAGGDISVDYASDPLDVGGKIADNSFRVYKAENTTDIETEGILESALAYEENQDLERISGVIEGLQIGVGQYANGNGPSTYADLYYNKDKNLYIKDYGNEQHIYGTFNDAAWELRYEDHRENDIISANLDVFDHNLYLDTGLSIKDNYEIELTKEFTAGVGDNSFSITRNENMDDSYDIDISGAVEADLRYDNYGDTEYIRGLVEDQRVTLGKYKNEALLGMLHYDWGYAYLVGSLQSDILTTTGYIYEDMNERGYFRGVFTGIDDLDVYGSFANLGSEGVLEGRVKDHSVYAYADLTGDNGDTFFLEADNDLQHTYGNMGDVVWDINRNVDNQNIHTITGQIKDSDNDWHLSGETTLIDTYNMDASGEIGEYTVEYKHYEDETGFNVGFNASDGDTEFDILHNYKDKLYTGEAHLTGDYTGELSYSVDRNDIDVDLSLEGYNLFYDQYEISHEFSPNEIHGDLVLTGDLTGALNYTVIDHDVIAGGDIEGNIFSFTHTDAQSGYEGNFDITGDLFTGSVIYTQSEDNNGDTLFDLTADLEGYGINYREWEEYDSWKRHLSFTDTDGIVLVESDLDIDKILSGDLGLVYDTLREDFGANLGFSMGERGGDFFISFDETKEFLEADIYGYRAYLQLGAENGYFQFDSKDDDIHLKIGSPYDYKVSIITANYYNDDLSLNFDNTELSFDKNSNILGLYDDNIYMVKVYTHSLDEMEGSLRESLENLGDLNFDADDRADIIRSTLKEVKVNPRELAQDGHIQFRDPNWDRLLMSLAYDVGEFSLYTEDMVDIINAEKPERQLYVFLDALTDNPLNDEINFKSKMILYELGTSILDNPEYNSGGMGIHGFSAPMGASFNDVLHTDMNNPYFMFGYDYGILDISVPIVDKYSRTSLGLSTVAEKVFVKMDNDIFDNGDVSIGLSGLVYAYRFPGDVFLRVNDSYKERFSGAGITKNPMDITNSINSNLMDVSLENDTDVVIPGAIFGSSIKAFDETLYANVRVMPYIPLDIDEQDFDIQLKGFGGSSDSSGAFYDTLGYATDINLGFKEEIFGQTISANLGKDINNNLSFSPELKLFNFLELGAKFEGPDTDTINNVNLNSTIDLLGFKSTFFIEQNLVNKTDIIGASIDKEVGNNKFNLSAGFINWDNAGYRENIERYLSFGAYINSKVKIFGSVFVNDVIRDTTYTSSIQFPISKDGYNILSLEGSMSDTSYGQSYEAIIKGSMTF